MTIIGSLLWELLWSASTLDARSKEEGVLVMEVIGDKGYGRDNVVQGDGASITRRKHNAMCCEVLRVWKRGSMLERCDSMF